MKVSEVMTVEVGFCHLEDDLTKAAHIMWQKDCGVVPVVDAEKRLAGVITDRDIAMAVATRNQKASHIKAREMMFRVAVVCAPEDDLKDALRKMRKYKVRRLPVTNQNKELLGIVSLTDILLKGARKKRLRKLVLSALKSIAKPPPIVLREEIEPTGVDE
jgi:CBS domain-containing protein